jgi:hypothetical protein
MVIYMDEYRMAKAAPVSVLKNGTYGDEIMHASWNPAVVYMFSNVAQRAIGPELPVDLTTVDVDEFLGKVYALATQI